MFQPIIAAPTTITQNGGTINVIRYARNVPPPGMFDMLFRRDGAPVDCWTDFRMAPPGALKPVMPETDVGVVRWRRILEKKVAAERQAMMAAAE